MIIINERGGGPV